MFDRFLLLPGTRMADGEHSVRLQRRAPRRAKVPKRVFSAKQKTVTKELRRTKRIPLIEVVERLERRRLVDVDEAVVLIR